MGDENETQPQAVGIKWGDPIGEARKQELWARLSAWEPTPPHNIHEGPFDGDTLTGAEVFWVVVWSVAKAEQCSDIEAERRLRLAHDDFRVRLSLGVSELNLQGVNLQSAHLEEAFLCNAQLHKANLYGAQLQGANLRLAQLQGADMRGVFFDRATSLRGATFSAPKVGNVRVADIRWGDVNLATLNGTWFPPIEDERTAHQWRFQRLMVPVGQPAPSRPIRRHHRQKQQAERLDLYRAAVRANRQVAVAMQSQGLDEEAARFAFRAHICQRGVYRLGGLRSVHHRIFSLFLDGLAGYGYAPGRTLFWYLVVICGFAGAYFAATHGSLTLGLSPSQVRPLQWYEALILSVSAFHGRGFFQPLQSLGDPVAILAAFEAVVGLLIEISFIATFTQRFFGSK